MIIGGYSLHLYCDGLKDCGNGAAHYSPSGTGSPPGEFHGETGSECRDAARKDGWLLNLKEGTAICPKCKNMGFKPGRVPE